MRRRGQVKERERQKESQSVIEWHTYKHWETEIKGQVKVFFTLIGNTVGPSQTCRGLLVGSSCHDSLYYHHHLAGGGGNRPFQETYPVFRSTIALHQKMQPPHSFHWDLGVGSVRFWLIKRSGSISSGNLLHRPNTYRTYKHILLQPGLTEWSMNNTTVLSHFMCFCFSHVI